MSNFSIESLGELDTKNYLKFMRKVEKRGSVRTDMSPCWFDITSKASSGYGQIMFQKIPWNTHRYSYYIHNCCPEMPEGYDVAHLCDNKACCNPEHLVLQLHRVNCSAESLARVKTPKPEKIKREGNYHKNSATLEKGDSLGELNNNAKLNWEKVKEIRARHAKGLVYGELKKMATEYHVAKVTIEKIIQGKIWKVQTD